MTDKPRNPLRRPPRSAEELDAVGRVLFGDKKWDAHMASRERARRKAIELGLSNNAVSLDAFTKGKTDGN